MLLNTAHLHRELYEENGKHKYHWVRSSRTHSQRSRHDWVKCVHLPYSEAKAVGGEGGWVRGGGGLGGGQGRNLNSKKCN